jgi:archaellum biogenesis protein FlaJ (TadC family)
MFLLLLLGAAVYGRIMIKNQLESGKPGEREKVGRFLWIAGWVIAAIPIVMIAFVSPFVSYPLSGFIGFESMLDYTFEGMVVGAFVAFIGRKYMRGESTFIIKEAPRTEDRVPQIDEVNITTDGTKTKMEPKKVEVLSLVFSLLMCVYIFITPFIGNKGTSNGSSSEAAGIAFLTSFPAALVGFFILFAIPAALITKSAQTAQSRQTAIRRSRKAMFLAGTLLVWAIGATVLVVIPRLV